ncbi:MAG: NfeD family protein [Pseudomonadales bacterium]|nr:NfeD family protein [Pseudomonadales bacterium]
MDFLLNTTAWLIIGALLMISELIVPGGIVFFLGAACAIVAGAIYFGLVTTWVDALTLFFVTSLFLIISLRAVVSRFAEGDSTFANTAEILDEVDELVEVIETIGPADNPGLVKFHGTQWRALGEGEEIPTGSTARIVARENISLLVRQVDPMEKDLH